MRPGSAAAASHRGHDSLHEAERGVCHQRSWSKEELVDRLPAKMRRDLATKKAFTSIHALLMASGEVVHHRRHANRSEGNGPTSRGLFAGQAGLGKRINMIMQSVFFKLSGVMPFEEAINMLKKSIKKMYGKKGDKVVQMNIDGVDASVSGIIECPVPEDWATAPVSGEARSLLNRVLQPETGDHIDSDRQGPQEGHRRGCQAVRGERAAAVQQLGWQRSASERLRAGRPSAIGHQPVREAWHCHQCAQGGHGPLHPMQQVQLDLPARSSSLATSPFCLSCALALEVRPFLATQQELSAAPKDFKEGSRAAIGGGVLDNYQYRIQAPLEDLQLCGCVRSRLGTARAVSFACASAQQMP